MEDLFFQMLPRSAADLATLRRDYFTNYAIADNIAFARAMLVHDPKDADSRTNLGAALVVTGKTDHFEEALRLNPSDTLARTNLQKAKVMLQKH